MLKITVTLIPGGFEPLRRTVAAMSIANLSNLADRSDYRVEAIERQNRLAGLPARSFRTEVKDHDRRQSVWALVAKAALAVAEAEPFNDG
jgi:hypothetical protein